MIASWHFREYVPGDTNRRSTADSFFDPDNVSEPGEAVVREGIQNSLDATDNSDGNPAVVRISLIDEESAPDWQDVQPYFASAWPHYVAERSGLHPDDIPTQSDKCTALVFEDIGATGLLGDDEEPFEPEPGSDRNDFYNFFRAEAVTEKREGDRGSRGIGKATFIQASRVNTMFGLTIRKSDDRRLLMGRTVLNSHRLNQRPLHGDGYFGIQSTHELGFTLPVANDSEIQQFADKFNLVRKDETGLSVIVPWPDREIDDKALIKAVVRNYFWSILAGRLDVWVETQSKRQILERNSFLQEARTDPDLETILSEIELADWVMRADLDNERLELNMPPAVRGWSWNRDLFPDGMLQTVNNKLHNREPIALRVPVTVRKKQSKPEESYFDVYMTSTGSNQAARPLFIRDDILISNVRPQTPRGIRALVIIQDEPLNEFLKKSENPSHTEWQRQRVRTDYVSAAADLEFVRSSVRQIYNLAMAEDKQRDKRLLSGLFPVPGRSDREDRTPPDPAPPYISIRSTRGGFTITRGREQVSTNDMVEVYVAYDVRRGSPAASYRPADFQLTQPPISYQPNGVEIENILNNHLTMRIIDPDDFSLSVTGFDQNRQIWVKADVMENRIASSQV